MVVVTREIGASIFIGTSDNCVVTLCELFPDRVAVRVRMIRAPASSPGRLESRMIELGNKPEQLDATSEIMLIDLRGSKVRIGVRTPNGVQVEKLEVFEGSDQP